MIINKLNAPVDEAGRTRPDLSEIFDDADSAKQNQLEVMQIFNSSPIRVLGCVPWSINLIATRAIDMAKHLKAEVINQGDIKTRRIKSITFCARSLPHMIEHFKPGSLLVTSADRPDVIVAASLAAMNGVEIGAVLLTVVTIFLLRLQVCVSQRLKPPTHFQSTRQHLADLVKPTKL